MLYLIGLGLGDEKDITIKGLEAVKNADLVFLESYTSVLGISRESLSVFYGKEVLEADREMTEGAEEILSLAKTKNVAFLVVGDPFSATTHADLILRARKEGIPVQVIHNASILNAAGKCGLQLYRFGETVSLVFFTDNWKPDSFYDKIARNRASGLHTLCLLDIQMKEPNLESLARGKVVYEPPRIMTISQAIEQLLYVEHSRKQNILDEEKLFCVGLARIGHATECIAYGSLQQLARYSFGPPPHSLIIPGELHFLEAEHLESFRITKENT
ncbi:hypothetical protein GAYE_SCF00G1845 [Galdieria yellowstonensis]|uniref:diphthine methyl ester synthase n=1 Tax=Galdieria yellowstonensis TaxID=3028027 RepID=A0AAV9I979_9RHOD|nr:hypothetical protein GAYE_SCF00G1845 [Galdieria yellowstonensis]